MIRSSRIGLAHATLAIFAVAILVQAARVQLVHGKDWRAQAAKQQTTVRAIPAPRGEIFDETHRILAQSRDLVRLEIAPREVNARDSLRRGLTKLGVEGSVIGRALDTTVKYVVVPGEFLAVDASRVTSLRGVHTIATTERAYAASAGAQGILGHVDATDKAVDGLELSLDSILRGTPGRETIFKDWKGQSRESPIAPATLPIRGNSVVLTINADLEEIAEKSLADAVQRMGAEGGDIVILDPFDGDILAMASRRLDPRQTSATAITEPFEPGSTAKPFMAAGLIERGRVTDADSVDTGNGVLQVKGRPTPIVDEHLVGRAPLADVLRWSSNVGIVKFSERLSDREKFETFRDFGFGTPTGLPYPTESPGVLRAPKSWSAQSAYSMPMGYEISVTPLQLAVAYAAFANGGELVEPALVKEIDGPDGVVRYRHERRVVRRVMPQPVADKVRHMLLDVVDEGTALQAALDNYQLAGKTGTPRATVHGHYVVGRYNPNFVGIFPGDAPQFVIVVKLTAPRTSIFAAETAAPVSKVILQTAIAARDAALDRAKLASSMVPSRRPLARVAQANANAASTDAPTHRPTTADDSADAAGAPLIVTLPVGASLPSERILRPVPDVRGLDLRAAVRSLHNAGFHVQLGPERVAAGAKGGGAAGAIAGTPTSSMTSPAAGELAQTGTVVRLIIDY
ncbi:MAG TPA: penicillin-binding transpeptidase domain-containing protein [Gemmatimonadaceae bacterium]|jgi:cell division protein FtsI (penicillin-binding protein 3)|nr:penicillin-binding transpeptidase domain-containing protein [Gemmatimonadaceae bacterium]